MAKQSQCERALERFEGQLNKIKNVVGLGIVPAQDDDQPKGSQDRAVAVYVSKKLPLSKLAKDDRVPESLTIPGRKGDIEVPVRVIEQGVVQKEAL